LKRHRVPSGSPPAIILRMNLVGLGIARSLGRAGVKVIAADYHTDEMLIHTKYCRREVKIKSIREDKPAVNDELLALAEEFDQMPVLIPTTDPFVEFLNEFRGDLCKRYRFALPPDEMVMTILNKRRQLEFAQTCGLQPPITFYPASLDESKEISKQCPYPVFIKPESSLDWPHHFNKKGFVAKNPEELMGVLRRTFTAKQDVMVQEIIPGPSSRLVVTSGYFNHGGTPVATFQERKLRQFPPDFGIGTLTQSCIEEEAFAASLGFFKSLRYEGMGEVELKRDPRDDRLKLMEINPRAWTQIGQPGAAGVDLPLIEYCDLARLPLPEIAKPREGVRWWEGVKDYRAFRELHGRDELSWSAWIRSFWGAECLPWLALDDLGPFLRETGYGLKVVREVVTPSQAPSEGPYP
jgi:D-aspartate ligase